MAGVVKQTIRKKEVENGKGLVLDGASSDKVRNDFNYGQILPIYEEMR